ncbi:ATP-binding cassette domain-containing protein [uncultured Enterococcus sp.]|uniref:ATP-binding cassette domain-containing protein n=1 Tax=uncultured Enterococcus sp. TaxID=167972 RepID=UPI0025FA1C0D|nr:ATP-binding cassette domain-containing protein [uncultured Enterococcus sp.]
MIELIDISKTYQATQALANLSLTISDDEIVGIVGKSGSGKSTLLRLINGVEHPTTGKIRIDGQELQQLSKKALRMQKANMGVIFQQFDLLNNLTVIENIALPLKIQRQKNPELVAELLHFVGLADKANMYPASLSGGEKQRVAIARALVRRPKFLLCDEATSALDETNTKEIIMLLKKVHQRFSPTILFVSHELETVKQLCTRVLVFENSQYLGEVLNHPETVDQNELNYFETVKARFV